MIDLLARSEARVHLDPRKAGVQLPAHLRRETMVRLDYGYGLSPAIPDLVVDDEGIAATLSFNRTPFKTFVPWNAVFLIADFAGQGAVWQEDIPAELLEGSPLAEPPQEPPPPDTPAPSRPRPSHLKLVK